jgi:hypothetical protein
MRVTVAAGILAVLATLPVTAQERIAEPRTGVEFDVQADGRSLLGVGLRVKKILFIKAKVYAVGLYVADTALTGPLAIHAGKLGTPAFYQDLVWGDFDKQLTLKFVRGLDQKKIQGAMREALEGKTDAKLLDRFVSYFPEIEKGQECVLRWAPGGSLETTMAGEARPPIRSKDFAAALFGLYVGEHPVQDDLKRGLVARAPALLKP